jgi:hypothetical protein
MDDLDVSGMTILKWILRKWDGRVRTRFFRFGIETSIIDQLSNC